MNILFVCTGNICRSPLAEGILRQKFEDFHISGEIDSAGFEPFHRGDPADPRAIRVAREHGSDITGHRARLFSVEDFDRFDKIYVMDNYHYQNVRLLARNPEDTEKIEFVMNIVHPGQNRHVPDPYYESYETFRLVYLQLETVCSVLASSLKPICADDK
jgi:protein-tyrosine phosphatase